MSGSIQPYDDLLEDEALAPLKRNHACLQCKKRKVKCDGVRPTCAPCLRSHAHALRSAQRNGTSPPALICTYTETDADGNEDSSLDEPIRRPGGDAEVLKKRKAPKRPVPTESTSEEKAILLAKIAELESQLAELRPLKSISPDRAAFAPQSQLTGNSTTVYSNGDSWGTGQQTLFDPLPANTWDTNVFGQPAQPLLALPSTEETTGFENMFMVPTGWPRNLPSPFLLEHLVETFFASVPQTPRMIHRASFLPRIHLPPTHPNFPNAALLHGISAMAALHTAWVNSVPPEHIESVVERHKQFNNDLEGVDDFALSQAEAARRVIHLTFTSCAMADGQVMFEQCIAGQLITDVYFAKGLPMLGWEAAGIPGRMVKSLELGNRNSPKGRVKEPLLPPASNDAVREERLGVVWGAFMTDAGFNLNGGWGQSIHIEDVRVPLPASTQEFNTGIYIKENPQHALSPDLYSNHPVPDTAVLAIKATILGSRAARWLQSWHQREVKPGDDFVGLRSPELLTLLHDIHEYKRTVPEAVKNVPRTMDSFGSLAVDANLLTIHAIPNVALAIVHEPFVDYKKGEQTEALTKIQKAYESIIGLLHVIPSNFDLATVITPVIAFSLYTTGRIIACFYQRALELSQYDKIGKYRSDMAALQAVLGRYGQHHALGLALADYLAHFLELNAATFKDYDLKLVCSEANRMKNKPATIESTQDEFMLDFAALASGSHARAGLSSGSSGAASTSAGPPSVSPRPTTFDTVRSQRKPFGVSPDEFAFDFNAMASGSHARADSRADFGNPSSGAASISTDPPSVSPQPSSSISSAQRQNSISTSSNSNNNNNGRSNVPTQSGSSSTGRSPPFLSSNSESGPSSVTTPDSAGAFADPTLSWLNGSGEEKTPIVPNVGSRTIAGYVLPSHGSTGQMPQFETYALQRHSDMAFPMFSAPTVPAPSSQQPSPTGVHNQSGNTSTNTNDTPPGAGIGMFDLLGAPMPADGGWEVAADNRAMNDLGMWQKGGNAVTSSNTSPGGVNGQPQITELDMASQSIKFNLWAGTTPPT